MKAFFLILSFLFSYVHSQTSDSCNINPLNLQPPPKFDTSNLHCVSVWDTQGFILRYAQGGAPNVWNFLLSAPNRNGYVAIGFSPNGNMVGSNAVVGWAGAATRMQQYFLGGQRPNLVTAVNASSSSNKALQIVNSSISLESGHIYMGFQLITDQPTNRLLYAVGPVGILPSGNSLQLTQHDDMTSRVINYATGQFQTQKSPQGSLRRSHGLLNMFGWAILMPIGVMVARYMRKWDPIWFYSHAMIQSFGFLLGFAGIICGLVLENRLDASVTKHKAIGIFILVFGCLQVIAFLGRPDKASKVRKYWNWYHFGVGRALIFLAAVNVFYGIHLGDAGSGWNAGFAVFLALVFVLSLILELRMCFRK